MNREPSRHGGQALRSLGYIRLRYALNRLYIKIEQFCTQSTGQLGQFLRIAVPSQTHLHDQVFGACHHDPATSVTPISRVPRNHPHLP